MPSKNTNPNMTAACPECDSATLEYRVQSQNHRCDSCNAIVDEPNYRERHHKGSIGGLPKFVREVLEAEHDD